MNELVAMPDVDGALVSGACLTAGSFTQIIDGGVKSPIMSQSWPIELTAREGMSTMNVLGESLVWSMRDQAISYWISAPEEKVWT